MRKWFHSSLIFLLVVVPIIAVSDSEKGKPENDIIALEKAALERWGNGDPFGFVEISADEITYFDPSLEVRLDGHDLFKKMMASLEGKINVPKFELLNPKVQLHGEVGVLTFNLVNYDEDGKIRSRWNSTEVYRNIEGKWRLIHSHWSFTKPDLTGD